MTSTPSASASRIRKAPAERRAEILQGAMELGVRSDFASVTVRKLADHLGVRPGLISHYFASVDELLAEVFAGHASAERDDLFPAALASRPREAMERFLALVGGVATGDASALWFEARHRAKDLPALRACVRAQEDLTRQRLVDLVTLGEAQGCFRVDEPVRAATAILVVVDGMDSYTYLNDGPDPVLDGLLRDVAGRYLGTRF